jgi:hypothetical protein
MKLEELVGKTIRSATRMKKPEYDDDGWLKLEFTDGTSCVVVAYYCGYTGKSEDEYPTGINVTEKEEGLVPLA